MRRVRSYHGGGDDVKVGWGEEVGNEQQKGQNSNSHCAPVNGHHSQCST